MIPHGHPTGIKSDRCPVVIGVPLLLVSMMRIVGTPRMSIVTRRISSFIVLFRAHVVVGAIVLCVLPQMRISIVG